MDWNEDGDLEFVVAEYGGLSVYSSRDGRELARIDGPRIRPRQAPRIPDWTALRDAETWGETMTVVGDVLVVDGPSWGLISAVRLGSSELVFQRSLEGTFVPTVRLLAVQDVTADDVPDFVVFGGRWTPEGTIPIHEVRSGSDGRRVPEEVGRR